jgi:hypothetical protein
MFVTAGSESKLRATLRILSPYVQLPRLSPRPKFCSLFENRGAIAILLCDVGQETASNQGE